MNALVYIINKIILFNDFFIRIKKRIIKIKEEELYINQINIIIMRSRQERSIKTMRIYYVFNFDANLLSCKRLCILKLKDRCYTNTIYLYKNHKNILKADYYENIYVLI